MTTGKTVLIVGANRGIGFKLASALAQRDWTVYGSVRPETRSSGDPTVEELEGIGATILEIDLGDEKTVMSAAAAFGRGPLDMLINVAGIGPEPDHWFEHTSDILMEKFHINTVGAFLTTKHFHPNLKLAGGKIINISSHSGSIGNSKGKDLAYRMSKAAINMMTVTLSKEFQKNGDNVAVMSIEPGYVATRLTNGRFRDDMAECIASVVKVVEAFGIHETGCFKNWKGETLPW